MPLERIRAYHVVRVLRVTIPIVVLALVSVFVWNFRDSRAVDTADRQSPPRLLQDASELAEEIRFSQSEAGRTAFTVEAQSNLGYEDGRNLLEGVIVVLYDQQGSRPERRFHGDRCGYDEETQDIQCDGNAELQLDPLTSVRTSAMSYDHARRTISTLDVAEIVRSGRFQGRADRMSVHLDENVLEVRGGVRIVTPDSSVLSGESARYYQDLSFIEISDGLQMENSARRVSGIDAIVELDPVSLDLTQVHISGNVNGEFSTPQEQLNLRADELTIKVSGGRIIEAQAAGQSVLEAADPATMRMAQTLKGERLDADFDVSGRLQSIEAADGAEMVLEGGERLTSEWIRNDLAGSVLTGEGSVLRVGEFRVEGGYFDVARGDLIRFGTTQPATVRMPGGFSRGQQTEANFDPNTRNLASLIQTGQVEFVQGAQEGTADRMEVRSGGSSLLLKGNAKIRDRAFEIDADEITLNRHDGTFTAIGAVRTLWAGEGEPVLVLSGRAEGDEKRGEFSSVAELWSGNTYVRARRIDLDLEGRNFVAFDDVMSTFGDLRFWSDRMDFDEAAGTLHHTGSVRAVSDDIELHAGELRVGIEDGQPDEVVAVDNVHVVGSNFDGRSDEAVYVRSTGTITLTGKDAEISDPSRGVVRGCRLVFDIESRDATVSSQQDCRVVTRRTVD